ncbi:Hypothetical_protein [Hexamita inflata]|uniref:Hypothetical_protein n=1 Tax=Hexamita inflata TaxID=28002 RepID=A0AA86Q5S1_9EUKA|nr:Hypothetical protein HINF_LOCUS39373 [Hexamita inflata]
MKPINQLTPLQRALSLQKRLPSSQNRISILINKQMKNKDIIESTTLNNLQVNLSNNNQFQRTLKSQANEPKYESEFFITGFGNASQQSRVQTNLLTTPKQQIKHKINNEMDIDFTGQLSIKYQIAGTTTNVKRVDNEYRLIQLRPKKKINSDLLVSELTKIKYEIEIPMKLAQIKQKNEAPSNKLFQRWESLNHKKIEDI